jgi:hypothetical protein
MSPSAKYVQLDLNSPEFQQSWVELEADDAERVRAALKKILKSLVIAELHINLLGKMPST